MEDWEEKLEVVVEDLREPYCLLTGGRVLRATRWSVTRVTRTKARLSRRLTRRTSDAEGGREVFTNEERGERRCSTREVTRGRRERTGVVVFHLADVTSVEIGRAHV